LTSESLKAARSESTGARGIAVTLYPLFAEAQNNSYTSLFSININHLFTSLGKLLSNNQASGLPHAQGQSTWHSPPAAPSLIAVRNNMLLESFCTSLSPQRRIKLESQTLVRGQIFRGFIATLAVSDRNSTCFRMQHLCFRIQHLCSWLLVYLLQSEVTKRWAAGPASSCRR